MWVIIACGWQCCFVLRVYRIIVCSILTLALLLCGVSSWAICDPDGVAPRPLNTSHSSPLVDGIASGNNLGGGETFGSTRNSSTLVDGIAIGNDLGAERNVGPWSKGFASGNNLGGETFGSTRISSALVDGIAVGNDLGAERNVGQLVDGIAGCNDLGAERNVGQLVAGITGCNNLGGEMVGGENLGGEPLGVVEGPRGSFFSAAGADCVWWWLLFKVKLAMLLCGA